VDAAYAGSAAIVPEFRHILNGAERADSLVVNPHKWFFTPFDLSAFYTRRPDILRRAFSLVPEYLRTAQDGRAVNYMDYGVPLGRRFRALKLWFVMRYFGHEKLAETIRNQVAWAHELAAAVDADPHFERSAPAPLSVVCFRYKGTDDENRRLLETVNATGEFFLSHTVLRGKFTLHLAIGNMGTTRRARHAGVGGCAPCGRRALALMWGRLSACGGLSGRPSRRKTWAIYDGDRVAR